MLRQRNKPFGGQNNPFIIGEAVMRFLNTESQK